MRTQAKHGHSPVPHFQVVPLKHLQRAALSCDDTRRTTHDGAGTAVLRVVRALARLLGGLSRHVATCQREETSGIAEVRC
jgi:hypothetical protein